MIQINAEIIAVGTELLLGQIANTNAQWISQQLAAYGINVHYHGVVGDNPTRVVNTFQLAQDRSDVIIVTGGLGPTDDDLTREAFQSISKMEIVEHAPSMEKIAAFYKKINSVMTPNNRKQARIFKDSFVIDNTLGMAPGMIVKYKEKTWIFLPGVPREMKQMFLDGVIPYLMDQTDEKAIIKSMVLRFIGIGEARLEHELKDIIEAQDNPTIAPLAQNDGVIIRLTAKESTDERARFLLNETKKLILDRVGDFFYGLEHETIETIIVTLLKKEQKKIAAAESLTGGKFTAKLISVPGASHVCRGGIVSYDRKTKEDLLGVSSDTIRLSGMVSEACALEMAENVLKKMATNIGIAFTGIAGPDSVEGKPIGTVYIAVCDDQGRKVCEKHVFQGDREAIRRRTVTKGFELLYHFLQRDSDPSRQNQ